MLVVEGADSASGLKHIPSGSVGVAVAAAALVVSCLALEVAAVEAAVEVAAVDLPVL